jgi:putative ABC transport system ATP-binding protein
VADRPAVLPAIVSAVLTGGRRGTFTGVGLDGGPLPVRPVAAAAAVPAAPASGVIVDRRYAELAASGNLSGVTQQVWVAAGARRLIEARLAAAHVRVLSVQEAGAVAARLGRQGPGLASVLFLADAAAAAVLAVAGAILGLYLSARRRRYEYAALVASGVARRTLRRALLAEQLAVLGFGAVVGTAAGLAAAAAVLPNVPEFIGPVAPPSSGEVYIDGVRLTGVAGPGQGVALVLQGYGLVSLLTAAENIEVALRAAGRAPSEAAAAAREALGQVGLGAHADHLVEELSGGQQQRTAVARALALRPRLLIADEPTAELDPAARALTLTRLFEVATGGGALVLATHDPEVAARCDRALDLRPGAGGDG